MKIIVPMAGIGKRMRPHTLTTPKPLMKIAGKPIVQRLVEDIAEVCDEKIDEIAFVIGDFGTAVENNLIAIAETLGAKGSIYHQEEALGTAHAILCAKESLNGKVIVAFADTLFKADFKLDSESDGIIWVKQIEDPRAFGVVKLDSNHAITDFVEKPQTFVSDLAIIGIYYFKDGEYLRSELQYLIDNNIMDKGEYQITNALENMKNKGTRFVTGKVDAWLDCGNKDATVDTNTQILEFNRDKNWVSDNIVQTNSVIIAPCYVGEGAVLINSVIGPHASIGAATKVENSIISNSIVGDNSELLNLRADNSMIGNFVTIKNKAADYSVGDYNVLG
jgi:glucose-1-phosphate thymidylyltransferase